MAELCSLHLLDLDVVARYVQVLANDADAHDLVPIDPGWGMAAIDAVRRGYVRALTGDEAGANAVSYGLARLLATAQPTFLLPSAGLTVWEARIDRGIGMLLRPPSRLFGEAGLPTAAARAMPIRLDLQRGLMGGAHVPARLVPDLARLLDERMARLLRRLADAEMDGVAVLGTLMGACAEATDRGMGLYEALDVITPEAPAADPPGAVVRVADRKRLDAELRRRLEEAAKPPKKPGLVARLLGRPGG